MDSIIDFDNLPVEMIELVLSFLPVPVLCRMRLICKTWNELIARPSFHNLCDINGKNNEYLFMWRNNSNYGSLWRNAVEPIFTGTFSFLDLDAQRWYSIQANELPRVCACGNEIETRPMAVDDGLVCELTSSQGTDENVMLTLFDPVAKIRWTLPAKPQSHIHGNFPYLITVVNNATRSFKVVVCSSKLIAMKSRLGTYIYESFTNDWRRLSVPNEVEGLRLQWASSAVRYHQTVFVGDIIRRHFEYDQRSLQCLNIEGDSWAEVWRMSFRRSLRNLRLVVSNNSLFVVLWSDPAHSLNAVPSGRNCPNSESLFHTNQDYLGLLFKIYEILIAENSRRPVVQLTHAQLRQTFGFHHRDNDAGCPYGYPCFDSNGVCNSVILISRYTGQIRRYYLANGSVDVLPPHPFVQTSEEPASLNVNDAEILYIYYMKIMKLSLRYLLAQLPKTSMGWR